LDRIYEKSIATFFRGQDNKIDKFTKELEDLRFQRDGNQIIRFDTGTEKSVIRISTIQPKDQET